ncbi:hypothetical protein DFH08DRAFT_620641, partial [Mycena albidolilacea]
FIKNVLGMGAERPGLYGDTDAYYGTVEQQGRLTLHMHMLIWIKSALSPQEIRDRLIDPDKAFQKDLVAYLESCHIGEFLTGTMEEVKAKVPYHSTKRNGLHDVIDHEEYKPMPVRYSDPTQTLPEAPPPLCSCEEDMCEACDISDNWWSNLDEVTDDLILRSKVHSCRRPIRGCLRKDGTCSARFPRDVFVKTEVDPGDGYINIKKLEPMINTVTPDLTYCLRCNTDVTSLLSGTSIKAVVAYVSDYITKSSLKIYHMFDSVRAVLDR